MRLWVTLGAVNAFLAVVAGAFGAHALKERLSAEMLQVFETGARYQMYHALALVLLGFFVYERADPLGNVAGWCFLAGIALFSFSLYALALSGVRALGIITPFGGLALLAGWALFATAALRS